MDDSQRLDAMDEYGLFVGCTSLQEDGVWKRIWFVQYGTALDRRLVADNLRDAIDSAVLDIITMGQIRH